MADPISNSNHASATAPPFDKAFEPLHGPDFSRDGRRITPLGLWRLRSTVLQRLQAYPYFALVRDCPGIGDAKDFRRVSRAFGRFPSEPVWRQLLQGKRPKSPITEIKVDAQVQIEGKYATRYSRTSQALEPHTDGSRRLRPYDIVILYCIAAEDEGGDTILVPFDDIVAKLNRDHHDILRAPTFPFGRGVYPIIESVRRQDTIRYYRTQILKSAQHQGAGLLVGADDTLEALDQALEDPSNQVRFKLQPQDLLLINNRKTLHGRTKMSDHSERLLLRAQVFSKKL